MNFLFPILHYFINVRVIQNFSETNNAMNNNEFNCVNKQLLTTLEIYIFLNLNYF